MVELARIAHREGAVRMGASLADADALLEGRVGPNALDHDDAALEAIEGAGVQHHAAAAVAEPEPRAIRAGERGEIVGMDTHGRTSFARHARGRVVEGGVEEGAR